MNFMDMRTVIFSYAISCAVCTAVMIALWSVNRQRFAGLGFWLVDYIMQFTALLLVLLRGSIPDFVSMVVSNTLLVGGTILIYIGLERFLAKPGPQIHNYLLLGGFALVLTFFVVVQPSLQVRNIIISLGLLAICFQCAWLMLRQVDADLRPVTTGVGLVFSAYCLVSLVRIVVNLAIPPSNNFFAAGLFDTLLVLTYQMLFYVLTLSLFLTINQRLVAELNRDIAKRRQAEEQLLRSKQETETLARFPAENPNPVLRISREGSLLYANAAAQVMLPEWSLIVGQPAPEVLQQIVREAVTRQHSQQIEVTQGERTFSVFITFIAGAGYANLYALDITERKQAEQLLQARMRLLEYAPTHSQEELLQKALDETGALTLSPVGFYLLVEPDQETISLQSWYNRSSREFYIAGSEMQHRNISQAELWAECVYQRKAVIHNDYDSLPGRKGLPAGHTPFSRELAVPVLRDERVVAVLGAGNKPLPYTQKDVGIVTLLADVTWEITARKRAEAAEQAKDAMLSLANERFTLAARAARLGVWDWDIQNNELAWDERMYALYGIKKEDFAGAYEAWLNSLHPDDRLLSDEESRLAREGQKEYDTEFRVIWPGGAVHYIKAYAQVIRDETGRAVRMIGINYDVTEARQAEAQLRRQNQYLAALQETTIELLSQLDLPILLENIVKRAGLLMDTSAGYLDLVEPETGQLKPQVGIGVLAESLQYSVEPGEGLAGTVWQTGQPLLVEDYDHWVGRISQFSVGTLGAIAGVPLLSGGRVLGVLGLAYLAASQKTFGPEALDILAQFARLAAIAIEDARLLANLRKELAARKQAEQALKNYSEHLEELVTERTRELRQAQEKLVRQERLAVLGQLAGSVGHELRNPLGVMANAVYYLKLSQPQAGDKIKEYYAILEHEIRTAEKVISDLLDFARLKAADQERVVVANLVQQALVRYPVPDAVQVIVDLPPDLPPVFVDQRQVLQVLGNLITNAYQAMPGGGALVIMGQPLQVGPQPMVAIHVEDNGVGIPAENMSQLFEPLFTTKVRGIGLGLPVSQKLIEANNGRIEVRSQLDVGSTFTIYLPVEKDQDCWGAR